jgi:hypothetical protein
MNKFSPKCSELDNYYGGSKMVTRTQKKKAWDPWIKKLAETLEPDLVEIKHQAESKLWHPEPLTLKSFSTPHYTEKAGGLPLQPSISSKPAWKTFGRANRWVPCVMQYSPPHPCDKPAYPPGHNEYQPQKKNWTIKNELKTSIHKGTETLKVHWRMGEGPGANLHANYW